MISDEAAEHVLANARVERDTGEGLLDAAVRAAAAASPDSSNPLRLDKVGFVRSVLAALDDPDVQATAKQTTLDAFRTLFRAINKAARAATRAEGHRALKSQIQNRRDSFEKDFPNGTTRRHVDAFLDEIEELVQHDYTREADITRLHIGKIRQDHALHDEPGNPVTDWDRLRDDLTRLEYALSKPSRTTRTPREIPIPHLPEIRTRRRRSA